MKNEITKLETVPTSIEDMKEVLQELWNEVDPTEWRYLTERLTYKLEDVIDSKGMATVHWRLNKCSSLIVLNIALKCGLKNRDFGGVSGVNHVYDEQWRKLLQTLVKPTQLLLATRLGYKVKLGSSSSKQFDSYYKDTVRGGGSVSIFGIPCSIGGSASHSTENTTHNLNWNSTNQEFTVDPTDNAGFATIVGLIGEKVQTGA